MVDIQEFKSIHIDLEKEIYLLNGEPVANVEDLILEAVGKDWSLRLHKNEICELPVSVYREYQSPLEYRSGHKITKEYEEMTYMELMHAAKTASVGKEARCIHKALKKYGDGLAFCYRYPNLPIYISLIALIALGLAVFVTVLK